MAASSASTLAQALSPLDGRYSSRMGGLPTYLSDFGLVKNRVHVEIEYLIQLVGVIGSAEDKAVLAPQIDNLRLITTNFSTDDLQEIATIEKKTNHDVKAVEYFLQPRLQGLGLGQLVQFIHFGITSQDINNVAYPLMVKGALESVYLPALNRLIDNLKDRAAAWLDKPMLARTHGQPATPTRVGKELYVWVERLSNQLEGFHALPRKHTAKFGGAVGCFNAHVVAYPSVDWISFADSFISSLSLSRQRYTTQIEHYDGLATIFHFVERINTILLDLVRDVWTYISLDYFRQTVKAGEVGSSTMPHKVNPIDFENAEGNLGLANALFSHMASKLPVSRLQRDLSDSTVLRNIGVPFGHSLLAIHSIQTGLAKLQLNEEKLKSDLVANWVIVAEAIQTVLRRENVQNAYEQLKDFTRTADRGHLGEQDFIAFINSLPTSAEVKAELLQITPFSYIGVCPPWTN